MMTRTTLRATAAPLAAVLLLGACYRYVPETSATLEPGAVYRAHLTPEGTQQVTPVLGANVGMFDARVINAGGSDLLVAMSATVRRDDPRRTNWSGEEVTVPRSAVQGFDRRELDRKRTIGAAVGWGVGMLVVSALWRSIQGRASGGDNTPGPTPFDLRVP